MKIELSDTQVVVSVDNGMNPAIGETPASPAAQTWSMRPDQAEKMLATFEAGVGYDPVAGQARGEKISKGDAADIRDAANEYRKQRDS